MPNHPSPAAGVLAALLAAGVAAPPLAAQDFLAAAARPPAYDLIADLHALAPHPRAAGAGSVAAARLRAPALEPVFARLFEVPSPAGADGPSVPALDPEARAEEARRCAARLHGFGRGWLSAVDPVGAVAPRRTRAFALAASGLEPLGPEALAAETPAGRIAPAAEAAPARMPADPFAAALRVSLRHEPLRVDLERRCKVPTLESLGLPPAHAFALAPARLGF